MIIFIIALAFLIYFSYLDLKHQEIKNEPILAFFLLGLVILYISGNSLLLVPLCLLNGLLFFALWKFKSLGGADVKILSILPIFYLLSTPINLISGQIIFLIMFGLFGTAYGLIGQLLIKKKKYIPFLPLITFTYIIFYVFNQM
ncbi:MAG TPA: prepilin peptidase [Candidatus Paceibacterota bacterium]|nr:prepilin peptidase [Candidatus Paceibacterota bacterium]